MFDDNHYRWTFFHILCRCPHETPAADCPLGSIRKATVLENYVYATKEEDDKTINKLLDCHCVCMSKRRKENILQETNH